MILLHASAEPPRLILTSGCLTVSSQISVVGSIDILPTKLVILNGLTLVAFDAFGWSINIVSEELTVIEVPF